MNSPTMPKLTIFTPAWNRAGLLTRLFRSIVDQAPTDGSVEWLVIDDGSTDDTPEVLAQFAAERSGLVRFLRVENGGKHRAMNRAAIEARGDWILLVDSDDAVAEDAVLDVLREIDAWSKQSDIGLIRGLSSFPDQGLGHRTFHPPRNPCFHWEWKSVQDPFDSAHLFRRSALLLHPFPEFPGESFMAEAWLYHSMDRTHKVFFVNRIWTKCWYQHGGLSDTALSLRVRSPRGTESVYKAIVDSRASRKVRVRACINLWRYRFHGGVWSTEGLRAMDWLCVVPGLVLYLRDSAKMRRANSVSS